jgi:hypothetical protein
MPRTSRRAFTAISRRGRRVAYALGIVAVAAIAVAQIAGAAPVEKTTVTLGQTPTMPDPSCPNLPCQAVGSVTGFQVSTDQNQSPFLVKTNGTIKSWTLTLAQPTNSQRSFFNGFFGTPPEARLAILRRVPGTNPPRYNLRRQGAIKVLTPYLGQTVKFGSSLKVEKNDIIGITVPTWAPIFSQELSASNVWRASREAGACTNSTDIRQGQPQEAVGKRATYGCKYSTARLLYTATLVEEG